MCKVAKLSPEPIKSLIQPSRDVITDDIAEASELAEDQGNQPETTDAKKVLEQNVEEEVKSSGLISMGDVTFEQLMDDYDQRDIPGSYVPTRLQLKPIVEQLLDEADKLNKAIQETSESPYDTESKIKVVKSFLTSYISELQDQTMHDSKETADVHEESNSDLQSMPDDDLTLLTLMILTKLKYHICGEVSSLHSKLGDMESFIVQHVSNSIQSTVPLIVTNTLKEQLHGLLSDALKDTLPQLIKEPIKRFVSESVTEELPQEFNAFNKLESHRFVLLQKELSKSLHTKMRKSIRLKVRKGMKEVRDKLSFCTSTVATNSQHVQDLRVMFKDMVSLLETAEVFKKANVEGEKANTTDIVQGEQPSAQVVPNEEKALVVHNPEEKKSEGIVSMEDDSDDDGLDKQPLSKRFKIITLIPNPIPLNTFIPDHLLKPEEQQKSLHEFTDQLFGTTSSKFTPTPPRDLTKGKEVAIVKE
ncbi:hypothetical protein Tco_1490970 [Tanacetum coccineum]